MNIFYLSHKPSRCARWHCDKHVVKMILESCQLLYTAHHLNGGTAKVESSAPICLTTRRRRYKKAHPKHPCAIWTAEALPHYIWLCWLALELVKEHHYRFQPKRVHACKEHLDWLLANPPRGLLLRQKWLRDPPLAMPDEYKVEGDSVMSYRAYYNGSKKDRGLLVYSKRHMPHIFIESE